MRIALPIWENRISPVLDTAKQLLVVDVDGDKETSREIHTLPAVSLVHRIETLGHLGVDLLVCSAITRPLFIELTKSGIRIIPNVCGDADEIIKCIIAGEPIEARFAMPGRGRRHRYHRGLCDFTPWRV